MSRWTSEQAREMGRKGAAKRWAKQLTLDKIQAELPPPKAQVLGDFPDAGEGVLFPLHLLETPVSAGVSRFPSKSLLSGTNQGTVRSPSH